MMKHNESVNKRKVIVITDGDQVARHAVESAGRQIGARVISSSAGNPTPLNGKQILSMIEQAPFDPVLVMFDDNGDAEENKGEKALRYIAKHSSIEVLGAIAVASNTEHVDGAKVDISLDLYGRITTGGVDKDGFPTDLQDPIIYGDTVDVLNELHIPIIIGIGDLGKMKGKDSIYKGAPITLAAIKEIMSRSGFEGVQ